MAAVQHFDRITIEPGVRGMRITVRRIPEFPATHPDQGSLLSEYPFLEPEDLQQTLAYAAAVVDDELIPISRVA